MKILFKPKLEIISKVEHVFLYFWKDLNTSQMQHPTI
jgi:hypothetical protein